MPGDHPSLLRSELPAALLINLPRDRRRLQDVTQRLEAAGVAFEAADAVDGAAMSDVHMAEEVTALGRLFMTPGMIGCFLSHRRCWAATVRRGTPVLIVEDDVEFSDDFADGLCTALAELAECDGSWDVCLAGALGCVHPGGWYGANILHGLMGGGLRFPRRVSQHVHVPARPFGTHCYVLSPAGAQKLLELCPRANFHVDVAAWGQPGLRLYCATDSSGCLLAYQAPTPSSTIGAVADRRWLPTWTVDTYTRAEFAWAFNAPVLQLCGHVLTIGRSLTSTLLLLALAVITRSAVCQWLAGVWIGPPLGFHARGARAHAARAHVHMP